MPSETLQVFAAAAAASRAHHPEAYWLLTLTLLAHGNMDHRRSLEKHNLPI